MGNSMQVNIGKLIEMYSRQVIVKEIGVKGLVKFLKSRVAVFGCGATGSTAIELLARAGVGFIRAIDRDFVDISNIPRTHLLTERDAREAVPKAVACANNLKRVFSVTEIEPVVTDVNSSNIEELIQDVDLIIDGSDNFTIRYLINDAAVKHGKPWIFIGVERWYGDTMFIVPGKTACFRCLIPNPPPEVGDVCNILGVVNTTVNLIVSAAVTEALKYLLSIGEIGDLIIIDTLRLSIDKVKISRNPKCPTCGTGNFEFLATKEFFRAKRICGTNAVQVYPREKMMIDTEGFSQVNLKTGGVILATPYIARSRLTIMK